MSELADLGRARAVYLELLARVNPATPCWTCEKFKGAWCDQWNAMVPVDHQAAGCDQYIDNIPF